METEFSPQIFEK